MDLGLFILMSILIVVVAGTFYYIGAEVTRMRITKNLAAYVASMSVAVDAARNLLRERSTASESILGSLQSGNEKIKQAHSILEEVNQITQQQGDLMNGIDGPSKGAAFSRWRNEVITKLKQLESEKMVKLRAILDLGLDPKVATMGSDGVTSTKRKLSEVMKEYETEQASKAPPPLKTKGNSVKPTRKLKLIKDTKLET